MTPLLPELRALPAGLVLDGELVAFNKGGDPHFPLLVRRVLHGDRTVATRLMIFDVLRLDGDDLMSVPFQERRQILERLNLDGLAWATPAVFDDGVALYEAVCERGSRASWRSRSAGTTAPVSAAGSRSRIPRTGDGTSSWSP
jgi:bifunctional non-homologous end joining protein LigD